jgi:hypothetical protein
MNKMLVILSVMLMLVFSSVVVAQNAPTDNTVTPDVAVNDPVINITPEDLSSGFNDGMDLIVPPFVDKFFPNFTPPPPPSERDPLIKNNGFGVDFGPYLPSANEITSRTAYGSQYVWYGQERFDGDAFWSIGTTYGFSEALFEGTALEGSRLFFDITSINPASSDNERQKEVNYTLFSKTKVNEGNQYEMEFTTSNVYYDFTEQSSEADGQEVGLQVAFTNLLNGPNHKLIPSYYVGRVWDRDPEGTTAESDKGNVHVVGVDYFLNIDDNTDTDLHVFFTATQLDSVSSADSELSYTTIGTDLDLDFGNGVILTPYVHLIKYSDDSMMVEDDSNVIAGVSMNFHF